MPRGLRRKHRAAEAELAAQIAETLKPRGCGRCGATFIGDAAYTVHRDPGWPGGCLPPGGLGQLELRDGCWVLAGDTACR